MYIERIEQLEKGRRKASCLITGRTSVYYTKARYVLMICPRDRTLSETLLSGTAL